MLEKYSVDMKLVKELLALGACSTEQEALEKVASGEGPALVKEAKDKKEKSE